MPLLMELGMERMPPRKLPRECHLFNLRLQVLLPTMRGRRFVVLRKKPLLRAERRNCARSKNGRRGRRWKRQKKRKRRRRDWKKRGRGRRPKRKRRKGKRRKRKKGWRGKGLQRRRLEFVKKRRNEPEKNSKSVKGRRPKKKPNANVLRKRHLPNLPKKKLLLRLPHLRQLVPQEVLEQYHPVLESMLLSRLLMEMVLERVVPPPVPQQHLLLLLQPRRSVQEAN
mmetsp:Transcript_6617/g.13518  ORF Transcript_6617/g.13518 Transcript_6617/m.13518 type:complete len:225 (+) Transcript_6617:475-1149(+)